MSIRRKLKRTTKQYIIVVMICLIVMGGAAVITSILITEQIKERYSALLTEARQEMEENKRSVYIATTDLAAGNYITIDNVKAQTVYAAQPAETYITAEDIGKVVLIDVASGTQLLKNMLSDNPVSSELRELEYSAISVSSNISDNDIVDIRISYPNGEDYDVLSKKTIKGYSGDNIRCYLWLTEEEIIRLHNAIVDAYLYSGSYLYTTKYIEPNLQEATIVTYTPSIQAIELIKKNPNIVVTASAYLNINVRKALENRLADSLNKDISNQWRDISSDYIYQDNLNIQQENTENATTESVEERSSESNIESNAESDAESNLKNGVENSIESKTDNSIKNRKESTTERNPETESDIGTSNPKGADLGSTSYEKDQKEDEADYFILKEG